MRRFGYSEIFLRLFSFSTLHFWVLGMKIGGRAVPGAMGKGALLLPCGIAL